MSRSFGQNRYRRSRRQEIRRRDMQNMLGIVQASTDPIRRGFWGRLKWLFLGR